MEQYDSETLLVCSTVEFAFMSKNRTLPVTTTIGLMELIVEKTHLSMATVARILFREFLTAVEG